MKKLRTGHWPLNSAHWNRKGFFSRIIAVLIFLLTFQNAYAQLIAQVSDYAGSGLNESQDGTLTQAGFKDVTSICSDGNNNLYVLEIVNGKIRKITPSGIVTTIYSDLNQNFFGSGGLSAAIHVDAFSNIYVSRGYTIAKITGQHTFQIIAGSLTEVGYTNNNIAGQGQNARFSFLNSMTSDIFGNLYISEIGEIASTERFRIRRINPFNQKVETLFTSQKPIYGLCFDANGNFVFGEGFSVVKLNPQTMVKTVVAGHPTESNHISGPGTAARFRSIADIKVVNNDIYVLECVPRVIRSFSSAFSNDYKYAKNYCYITKISNTNVVTDIAGGEIGDANGVGLNARFYGPCGMVKNSSGDLFILDDMKNLIRKITFVPPAPAPTPTYVNATPSLCLGSTVDQPATITGSQMSLQITNETVPVSSEIKAACRNQNFAFVATANNEIKKYDFNGNLVETLPAMLTNISGLAADSANQIYAVAQDNTLPALTAVYRLQPSGAIDLSWGPTTSGVLNNVSAIAMGSDDGLIYVADTSTSYISSINPVTAAITNLPAPGNLQLSYFKPVSMAFDVFGDMYLADIGRNQILKRSKSDNNYYPVFPGLENDTLEIDGIGIAHSASGNMYLSSSSRNIVYELGANAAYDSTLVTKFTNTNEFGASFSLNEPINVIAISSDNAGTLMIPNKAGGDLRMLAYFMIKIAPQLPKGLFFDPMNGTIHGTPLKVAPYTTYTITTYGPADSTITTLAFSVDPSSLVSNNIGNKTSPVINTTDGLAVNFYDQTGCEPLATITDITDGNPTGSTQVKQTVNTNLPFFTTSSGNTQFVRRTTEVNSQKMDTANVRIELYFTYADIVHYNANNGTQTDFSNDTTAGTMAMSILQLHTATSGNTQLITHNTTATWSTVKHVWVANFPVTKFSTFMATTPDALTSFECASTEATEFAFGCTSAEYNGVTYTVDGEYTLNYQNQYGCDSIVHLIVFLDNNSQITMIGSDTLKALNTASGTTYQWVNCDNNYSIIPGATDSIFFAADTGTYACIITNAVCADTSVCAYINHFGTVTGLDELGNVFTYSIAPNPTNGSVQISSSFNQLHIEVYNALGVKVFEKRTDSGITSCNLTEFDAGIYLIRMSNENGQIITDRIIKQ